MKSLLQILLEKTGLFTAIAVTAALGVTQSANAATSYYFHVDGNGPGYGINANDVLSWDDVRWTALSTGAPTSTWASVSTLANAGFARFNSTTTPYTVVVNNTEYNAGLFGASGVALTINAAGSGNLNVVPGSITGGLPVQGFFPAGGTMIINAPITGTGGVAPNTSGGGTLELFGNNTYSGGTVLGTSSVLVYFNNNNAFGTGPINVNGTTFAPLLGTGGAAITLANSWTNLIAAGVNFAADPNTPVTLTGPVKLLANLNLRNNGNSTSPLTLSGEVSGSGGLNLTANSGGKITLSGPNTYTGATTLGVGGNAGANVILGVSSFNSVSGGTTTSSLGHPTTVANGTIGMGSTTTPATLIYTGAGETSDRVINLAGTTAGATIQADGTGALVLTAINTATGAGAKALTLQGTNSAANKIGKIVDSSSGATSVVKAQSGTWHLTGANTYTGGTVVNAGTLYLDTSSALPSTSSLTALSGASINLNFTGTNAINALTIDGTSQASGVWGPPGSGAPNQNAIFAGTGYINVLGKPVIIQQPVSGSVFEGDVTSFAFNVGVAGDLSSLTYQWKQNGVNIAGANSSSYSIPSPVAASSAGVYSVAVTNAFGFATSSSATLTVMRTNAYTQTIRGANPIAYWRLDETNGSIAYDAVSTNNGGYVNVNLNQPGFSSVTGSDPAIGLPANTGAKGMMVISNAVPAFSFGGFPFTLEAWAMSTNFGVGIKQRLISTLTTAGGGYGFGFPNSTTLEFTSGGIADYDVTLSTPLAQGVWYHFVAAYDGNNMNLYLNGALVGSVGIPVNIPNPASQFALGNNPLTFPTEQLYGGIDEVAIYNYALDGGIIANHYDARYSDLAAPTVTAPVVTPPTNYVSLTTTLIESAGGVGLTYQWYKGSGTGSPVPGATSSTLVLSNLQLSDAGSYHCVVTDAGSHTADSPLATVAVLPIPTSAAQLNLTNGLVLHLPFDSDYNDISGRQNNGLARGTPGFAGAGAVGTNALHYGTTNALGTNYITLGVRPDLQFSSNVDFTVAYWVRGNNTSLPFFCDSTNGLLGISALGGGFYFGPSTNGNSSWAVGLGGTVHQATGTGGTPINDGNWHHLVHVAKRAGSQTTYLDGVSVDTHAISFITESVDTSHPANIGQDGLGNLVLSDTEGDIDDLAVWRRTLTDLEVSGMYLAGATNHVSFAPVVSNPPPAVTIQIQQVGNQYQLVWSGGGTLEASPVVNGSYTNVTGASSPYTIPVSSGPQLFYRVQF